MSKTKKVKFSLKGLITNVVLAILPVLALIFLSQAYLTGKTVGGNSGTLNTGYDLISTTGDNAAYTANAVCIVFLIIFSVILLLTALLGILQSFGVLKGKTFGKVLNVLNIVSLACMILVATISVICICTEMTTDLVLAETVCGWAAIANLVIPVFGLIVYLISKLPIFKK